jgi:hypothetical protein
LRCHLTKWKPSWCGKQTQEDVVEVEWCNEHRRLWSLFHRNLQKVTIVEAQVTVARARFLQRQNTYQKNPWVVTGQTQVHYHHAETLTTLVFHAVHYVITWSPINNPVNYILYLFILCVFTKDKL